MDKQVAFNVDGLYIKLHGPFPMAIIDAANNMAQFSDRATLLSWLNREWPAWRKNVVMSENL